MEDETRAEVEARMKREHYEKYEALAQKIGIPALQRLMPVDRATMAARLKADEHLNNVVLAAWDSRAGLISGLEFYSNGPTRLTWDAPWLPSVASGLSLAERVCTLKHVARYHWAKEPEQVTVWRRSECHGPKWDEFIKVFTSGQKFEVDEEMWDYWLEVLPPVFMYQEIDYFPGREGTPTLASFGFVEGADYITVFWVEGTGKGQHFYGQRSNKIARGR